MNRPILLSLGAVALYALTACSQQASDAPAVESEAIAQLRAPAYPLVTIDPYTSAWSMADHLYDEEVKHWTGTQYPLLGVALVDGEAYRFMGKETPVLSVLAPTAAGSGWTGRYTTTEPAKDWFMPAFDDSAWKSGESAFGTIPQEKLAKTLWNTPYIWVRRTFALDKNAEGKPLYLTYSHDDDVTIYINGIKVVDTGNACNKDVRLLLPADVTATLKPEGNVIAACCHDRGGLAFLDFGLLYEAQKSVFVPQTATQLSAEVLPMNTIYNFTCGPVDLNLKFTAPAFLDNLELLSRPVNYISYDVTSNDGKKHDVKLYFEAGPEWAVETIDQNSVSGSMVKDGITYVCTSNEVQKPLNKSGDHTRIDWGTFYLAATGSDCTPFTGDGCRARRDFIEGKEPQAAEGREIGLVIDLGDTKGKAGYIMAGYDDEYSIQYFGRNLRPYWNRNNDSDIFAQFSLAAKDYKEIMKETAEFDYEMVKDATEAGGDEYAALCALAYRQSAAAHKLVESPEGEILWFSKENDSNGSIGTVDITYPAAPLYLIYNPDLVKGMMNHIFRYCEGDGWGKPFPAHDVGTYPLANGQTYPADMPVEEGGNMLCLAAAIAAMEGNADYAASHWDTLTTWTEYLAENGLDPENQLCTDDFAGHFAHNANLSVKAILGIASYAYLADMLGKKDVAEKYRTMAREMAGKWEEMANDGDHYRLTFDQPGTWSQKYNLVWDKLLGLDIFPGKVIETEVPYYLTKQNVYGLPLDNRDTYTKTDWIMWTATLAPDKETFMKFVSPVYKFMDETEDRVPMTDWPYTDKPKRRGFMARAVVGGYFLKMLEQEMNRRAAADE